MLALIKGVLTSSIPLQEKIMFLSSLIFNHSIHPDNSNNNAVVLETIFSQLSSPNDRYIGLKVLEIALQQNFNQFYNKGKWCSLIYGIIKDTHAAHLLEKQACKVLAMVIPQMANDSALSDAKDELAKDIYPLLLERIKKNVEWSIEACICVKMCLKTFPSDVVYHEHSLMTTILHQASYSVSSKSFEALAECFCELPYCTKDNSVLSIQCRWNVVFKQTLKTIESLQISCLKHKKPCEPYAKAENQADEFDFNEKLTGVFFRDLCRDVRRFANLCKCLAKLLSVQSKYSVKVPIRSTIHCLLPLYMGHKREKPIGSNEEVLYTFISQMQLAGLVVFESLIMNCNLQKHSIIIRDLIIVALESCVSPFSSQLVCELRVAVWRLLSLWLDGYGRNASKRIAERPEIIHELLKDIQIDTCESQQINNALQSSSKSKKTTSPDTGMKSIQMKENHQKNCLAALTSLESLLYAGAVDLSKGIFQEICNRVFNICHISTCNPFPPPFNDVSCRKKLYSVVQTIVLVIKPDAVSIMQTAMKILSRVNRDPSFKVRKWANKASVINRLLLYPKRPLPVSFDKLRQPNVTNDLLKYPEWSSEEYVQNPNEEHVSETLENVKIESSFQIKSDEVHSEEYMDAEPHYSEQAVENQCNGEDMLEIQSSSQCQDDEEDSEEEEEEEDEERNYEEEMNQDEVEQEMYIPSGRKVSISSAIQINSETAQSINEPEYEELAPCIKTEENSYNNITEDKCINGEEEVISDKDMPSSSVQQVITSENGIFGVEDDVDDEHEEEEEEENEPYPVGPPQKKQRIETIEDPEEDERPPSPTMDVMKASLMEILPSEEEVKSGKVQLSATCQL